MRLFVVSSVFFIIVAGFFKIWDCELPQTQVQLGFSVGTQEVWLLSASLQKDMLLPGDPGML